MADFLVGCDVGTGGTKAVVIDAEGLVLGTHYVEYPLITRKTSADRYPGAKAEHDPEWYWQAACETIGTAMLLAGVDAKDIRGVSISGLSPACILVDRHLRPLANAHIWMDRRGSAESDWIHEHIGSDRVFDVAANPIDPYYAAVKLLWEKNNRPELYRQAYKLQTAADYPCMKLTGKAVTDYSNACLIGIAFDVVKRRWDNELLEEIGLNPDKFPEAFPCDAVVGEVTREAAEACGLAPGTPVCAGTVDSNAAWTAAGAIDPGATQLVIGTAGVLGVVHDTPTFTRDMVTIIHTAESRTRYTTQATLQTSGGLVRWFRDTFGQVEQGVAGMNHGDAYAMLSAQAATVNPGSDGLIVLPYFMGERSPLWDTYARGMMFGLSLDHGRGHIVRAIMEGAAYAWRHNFELMQATGLPIDLPIVLSEGGAKSPVWRQIVADVLNVPCAYAATSGGAPLGNAVTAGVGVGVFKNYDIAKQWMVCDEYVEPIPENVERYNKLYCIFRDLYPAVYEQYHRLADKLD